MAASRPWFRHCFARRRVYEADSEFARERMASLSGSVSPRRDRVHLPVWELPGITAVQQLMKFLRERHQTLVE